MTGAAPTVNPLTIPDVNPIDAAPVAVHVPPGLASPNVIELPTQTVNGPVIADGSGFTVTTTVAEQPAPSE